ncbi:MAG: ABC transporter substrate-binding protein [Deltaproteobacteria bacterium]|nr:ABC transporter substrate-binding protein [Deltaproteobacteria bacterium]
MARLKTIAALGLALLIALGAAGCGGEADDPNTIRLVAWKFNTPGLWRRLADQFEKQHPPLKVSLEIGPHSSTSYHDMLTQKLKNRSSEVDVFLMDVIWPPEFASAGWALPLEEIFTEEQRKLFVPAALEASSWRGRVYGAPLYLTAGVLYFRSDLLERYKLPVPQTWPQMVSQAKLILAQEAGDMAGYSGQFKQYEGLVCDMLEFIWSAGGRALAKDGKSCLLNQPQALKAVRFVRDCIIDGVAPRGVLAYQEPESLSLFAQGGAVFLRNWFYAWPILNDSQRSKVAGKVGLAPLPHFSGGNSAACLGGWQVGLSAYSTKPAQALKLIKFLVSEPVQRRLVLEEGLAPTRTALYHDPWVLKSRPHFAELLPVLDGARPRPRTPLYPALSEVMQGYFQRAISDEDSDLPALSERAVQDVDRLLGLAGEQ